MEVIDLTNCDSRPSLKAREKTNVKVTRNCDGNLTITGFKPIKYVITIVDLPLAKNGFHERDNSRRTVLSSLENYLFTSKRKQCEEVTDSSEQNSSGSSENDQITGRKKCKTSHSQLILERWMKVKDKHSSPPNIPQHVQVQSITLSNVELSEGLTPINKVRPTKRKFRVKLSDPSKPPVVSEFSLTCTEDTIIRPCVLGTLQIPRIKFSFQPISNVENMCKDDIVDVIAICESFGEMQNIRLSNGSQGRRREIWLVDQSKLKIVLYIWGTNEDNFDRNRSGDVIAVKRAKVKFYAKINLDSSCLSSSTFQINPQIPEAEALRKWYCEKEDIALKVLSRVPKKRQRKKQ